MSRRRSWSVAAARVATASLAALVVAASLPGAAQAMRRPSSVPPTSMQLAFLATDGSVLAQGGDSQSWWKYAPDAFGNYLNGTWTQIATLPPKYGPSAYASAVLADGRLAIVGGEYNIGGQYPLQLTNLGAIYDPVKNTWTPFGHPQGWNFIGDSPSSVTFGGQFFVGQKLTKKAAYLDPKTLSWVSVGTAGKADFNAEEGFTLLPDGTILTADVKNAPNSERYFPSLQAWQTAGSTIVDLHSPTPIQGCLQYGPAPQDCYYPPGEIGPLMLRPDGTVFATGSGSGPQGSGPGHTAIWHPGATSQDPGTWTVGPDFPNNDNAGDEFAALLPSGNVLVFGNSGALYEFNGTSLKMTGYVSGVPLLLPTGQVMMIGSTVSLYTPSGAPKPAWAPHIMTVPTTLARGASYTVSGTQFNGLSQAMAFGDEFQTATNYPLVRIKNVATHHVFYARTHDHSSMGVATGSTPVSTHFDVPANAERGASELVVVANGIASTPVKVTVR